MSTLKLKTKPTKRPARSRADILQAAALTVSASRLCTSRMALAGSRAETQPASPAQWRAAQAGTVTWSDALVK